MRGSIRRRARIALYTPDKLQKALRGLSVERDACMAARTTLRIGGPADVLLHATSAAEVERGVQAAKEADAPLYILGNGSNVLVRDEGLRGLVIHMAGGTMRREGTRMVADAGVPLASLARQALHEGLQGLEWASGIPGTLGGACAMNAGAYGSEIKDVLVHIRYYEQGAIKEEAVDAGRLSYRASPYSAPEKIVLSATLQLAPDDGGALARARAFLQTRREKQPLDVPSAGSTFKRPQGHFAGRLIEEAGLKGYHIGGAQVSGLHAGFLINRGGASARDMCALIAYVQQRVFDTSGVMLEPEVNIW